MTTPKAVYLKITYIRHGAKALKVEKFVKITNKGMIGVDVTRNKISPLKSLHSLLYDLAPSNKRAYDKAINTVMLYLTNLSN